MTFLRVKQFLAYITLVLPIFLVFAGFLPLKADEAKLIEAKTEEAKTEETKVVEVKAGEAVVKETKVDDSPPNQALTQNLVLDPNKRLEASICADSMNRIAVINDRIIQVFGDSGAFESQNDGDTGQLFIKPTDENGDKNLSLTLITEQGITQDLTLKPTAKSAKTLIFKNKNFGTNQKKNLEMGPETHLDTRKASFSLEANSTYQDQLLVLLKQAIGGQLPLQETGLFGDKPSRSSPEGYAVSHHQSYLAAPYGIDVFHVKNITFTTIELQEKTFYQRGDLALSLQKRILPPEGQTLLYAVRFLEQEAQNLDGQNWEKNHD